MSTEKYIRQWFVTDSKHSAAKTRTTTNSCVVDNGGKVVCIFFKNVLCNFHDLLVCIVVKFISSF